MTTQAGARNPFRSEKTMIRVLLADDHAVVRQGVAHILRETSDIVVVGQAASGDELLSMILSTQADVCLLDLAMPGSGLELIERIHELRPTLRVLVFSMHPEEQYAVRCLAAHASGYLSKGRPPEEIEQAVRKVASGRRYISDEVAEVLAGLVVNPQEDQPHERLSNREYDIFLRLSKGEGSGEIAQELGLSVKSVSTYRSRVLKKLGLTRNAELTKYAIEHSLID